MILCKDLYKHFGDVEAVKGVSMEIPDGMFLGLLGPNGAGKTTLMRMMTGLLVPDTGTVAFDGQAMDRNAVAVKQAIGVTSQHVNLDKELTVEENMEFAGRLYRMGKAVYGCVCGPPPGLPWTGQCQKKGDSEPVRRNEAQADDCKVPDSQSKILISG